MRPPLSISKTVAEAVSSCRGHPFGWRGGEPQTAAQLFRLVVLGVGGPIIDDRGMFPKLCVAHWPIMASPPLRGDRPAPRGASKREVVRYFVDRQILPANADRDIVDSPRLR